MAASDRSGEKASELSQPYQHFDVGLPASRTGTQETSVVEATDVWYLLQPPELTGHSGDCQELNAAQAWGAANQTFPYRALCGCLQAKHVHFLTW